MRAVINTEILCRKCRKMIEKKQEKRANETLLGLKKIGIDINPVLKVLNTTLPVLRNHDLQPDRIGKRRVIASFLREEGVPYEKIGLILDRSHSSIIRLLKR